MFRSSTHVLSWCLAVGLCAMSFGIASEARAASPTFVCRDPAGKVVTTYRNITRASVTITCTLINASPTVAVKTARVRVSVQNANSDSQVWVQSVEQNGNASQDHLGPAVAAERGRPGTQPLTLLKPWPLTGFYRFLVKIVLPGSTGTGPRDFLGITLN